MEIIPTTSFLLERFALFDPALAASVEPIFRGSRNRLSPFELSLLDEETFWALGQDIELGHRVAEGLARLVMRSSPDRVLLYPKAIREACEKGLNFARILAAAWVPVLIYGDEDVVARFPELIRVMRSSGEYTLKRPLEVLGVLLEAGKAGTAGGFMGLLQDTFSRALPYKTGLSLSRILPRYVQDLPESDAGWRIFHLRRLASADFRLAEPFISAEEKGLNLLSEAGLKSFVSRGLEVFSRSAEAGIRFLSLESKLAQDACRALVVSATLSRVRGSLNRYLKARTGLSVSVASLTLLPDELRPLSEGASVVSDGSVIYLPEKIRRYDSLEENIRLYKCLAKLESAVHEFGTHDFELEKMVFSPDAVPEPPGDRSDLERFFRCFDLPDLAADLFTGIEHGRHRLLLNQRYPGIFREAAPALAQEMEGRGSGNGHPAIAGFYRVFALGFQPDETLAGIVPEEFFRRMESDLMKDPRVETSARWTREIYPVMRKNVGETEYHSFTPPFGRRIRPDLFFRTFGHLDRQARLIRARLSVKGISIHTADIRKRLIRNRGILNPGDLCALLGRNSITGEDADFSGLSIGADTRLPDLSESPYPAFWYPEWDQGLGDYLQEHVRVLDRMNPEMDGDFYEKVLHRRAGMVSSVRRAFERLKPEGLKLLRRWVEGDDFDYRALLDFVLDRRAGLMPSDRLYMKRVKEHRDVAVLLLVDLSRSTANTVHGSASSVMDLEKEAIVLFCEALGVLGDAFAIAGFSGNGRLAVDYFRIKNFEEPVCDAVKRRINAMAPRRGTRMGAAIRHATADLRKIAARVKLLLILSDGFPNDIQYKREYAMGDTRKAISEARSHRVHARAITVNIVEDGRLDAMYGGFQHNIISDVRQLPDKLIRIYSSLTR